MEVIIMCKLTNDELFDELQSNIFDDEFGVDLEPETDNISDED
jgi:hypothetical protein